MKSKILKLLNPVLKLLPCLLVAILMMPQMSFAWELTKHGPFEDNTLLPFCSLEKQMKDQGISVFLVKAVNENEKVLFGFSQGLLQTDKNYKMTFSLETKGQPPKLIRTIGTALDKDMLEVSLESVQLSMADIIKYERLNVLGFGDPVAVDLDPEMLFAKMDMFKTCLDETQVAYLEQQQKIEEARDDYISPAQKTKMADVKNLLEFAKIPYADIDLVSLPTKQDLVTWQSEEFVGTVSAVDFAPKTGFRNAVETHVNKMRHLCDTGFVDDIGVNEKIDKLHIIRADVACSRANSDDSMVSILFVKRLDQVMAFMIETEAQKASKAISTRNNLLTSLQKIAHVDIQ